MNFKFKTLRSILTRVEVVEIWLNNFLSGVPLPDDKYTVWTKLFGRTISIHDLASIVAKKHSCPETMNDRQYQLNTFLKEEREKSERN